MLYGWSWASTASTVASWKNPNPESKAEKARRPLSWANKHTKEKWVMLCIERRLAAPMQEEAGRHEARKKGTPQGGVISPLLANLFLQYALDRWIRRKHPYNPIERYADDATVHCRRRKETETVKAEIGERLAECGLELNAQMTKIVYCKDSDRKGTHEHEKFTFVGYEFRPRSFPDHHSRRLFNVDNLRRGLLLNKCAA